MSGNIINAASGRHARGQPGTNGLWVFVFVDMMIFMLMFVTYLSEKIRLPEVFSEAQAHLNPWFGLSNTLILLTSSWCMAEAVIAARRGLGAVTVRWLTWCLLLGLAFGINKLVEYHAKIDAGFTPASNSFYALYFVITGLHFLHVVGGMAFMLAVRNGAKEGAGTQAYVKQLENVGLFWHFVDLLWVFIFPMLYLAGLK